MENEVKEEVKNEEVQPVQQPVTPEPEKKSKGMVVVIVLLVIVVLGLGGYILYDKVIANKEETPTNNNNQQEEKKEEPKKEEENKQNEDPPEKLPANVEETVVNRDKKISYQTEVNPDGPNTLKKVIIGGKDVTSSIVPEYTYFSEINFKETKDFVAVVLVGFWTAGHGQDRLYAFDYNGNLLYKTKKANEDGVSDSFPSLKDDFYFKGEYEYKESENALYITYSVPCDADATLCHEFTDILENICDHVNEFKDIVASKVYKVTYSNGKFTNEELVKSYKMSEDSYFKKAIFDGCKY